MIFTYYPKDLWHKRKIDYFDPYNLLLGICHTFVHATCDYFCDPESQIHVFTAKTVTTDEVFSKISVTVIVRIVSEI